MSWEESQSHSFIIRIWLEERRGPEREPVWRGHVTHVPSGERRGVTSLDQALAVLDEFLSRIDDGPGPQPQLHPRPPAGSAPTGGDQPRTRRNGSGEG